VNQSKEPAEAGATSSNLCSRDVGLQSLHMRVRIQITQVEDFLFVRRFLNIQKVVIPWPL